jgi:predicted dehydrogenase
LAGQEKVRIGFIGAGDISNLHAAGVRACDRAELVGLWNRDNCPIVPDVQSKADEYGCRRYGTAEELVNDPSIDAIYVLTAMESHLKFARLAMEAGKHVLVEKPVGTTVAEIEEMAAIAEANGVHCVPGHNYIHEPQVGMRALDLPCCAALLLPLMLTLLKTLRPPPSALLPPLRAGRSSASKAWWTPDAWAP